MESWVILVVGLCTLGCDTGAGDIGTRHKDIGCDAGFGCAEDKSLFGACAQDRPHLCFCGADGSAATPNPDCLPNGSKPYAPYTHALCCP